LKNFPARQHACGRHCAAVACNLQLAIRSGVFRRKIAKSWLRDFIDAKKIPACGASDGRGYRSQARRLCYCLSATAHRCA
jgi:hypothetical protein